ncbi:NADH-quinone oxidoreductase subunit H, partial [Nonomuraea sp. NPDC005650]
WKVLIPLNLAWILLVAGVRTVVLYEETRMIALGITGFVVVAGLAIWMRFDTVNQRRKEARKAQVEAEFEELTEEPTEGGFPVPPLDLPHYHGVQRKEIPSGTN